MSNTVIRVENLGKKYILGHQKQERYAALRDVIANGAKSLGGRVLKPFGKKISDPAVEEFWALKDVSFEIKQGDRVGIIGRNGAGKSTLLKILSRITEPTKGRISINGRVASLLEVGTGFHPELTGRENIYLNGAILGMSKVEIKRKFDEIVAFAEVEKFLDTPVKRYSSGMYVRLAFAVAAHLEPEILVVDEVLAVGDAQFQQKCLGKMEDVGKEGRTVFFVSHNMSAVQRLCSRAIFLQSGNICLDSDVQSVVNRYLQGTNFSNNSVFDLLNSRRLIQQDSGIRLSKCTIIGSSGRETSSLRFGEHFTVCLEAISETQYQGLTFVVGIDSLLEQRITTVVSDDFNQKFSAEPGKTLKVKITFDELVLCPGSYFLYLSIRVGGAFLDDLKQVVGFEVIPLVYGQTKPHNNTWGFIKTQAKWSNAV